MVYGVSLTTSVKVADGIFFKAKIYTERVRVTDGFTGSFSGK